jgi:large conductance mechanosensitive channel
LSHIVSDFTTSAESGARGRYRLIVAQRTKEILVIKEFRDFINRGNLVEIAVAFVMGVAFASVVTSLTADIINPIVGKILTVDDLSSWDVAEIRIGAFLVAVLNFLIVALVMFFVVKAHNRLSKRAEEESTPSEEVRLLTEIRDSLQTRLP